MDAGRRRFLKVGAVLAPAVILTPGLLMMIKPRPIVVPTRELLTGSIGSVESFHVEGPLRLDIRLRAEGMLEMRVGDVIRVTSGAFGLDSFNALITEVDHSIASGYSGVETALRAKRIYSPNPDPERKSIDLPVLPQSKGSLKEWSITQERSVWEHSQDGVLLIGESSR